MAAAGPDLPAAADPGRYTPYLTLVCLCLFLGAVGKSAQVATYEDMIKTAHDEDLFEYYFTSQIAAM